MLVNLLTGNRGHGPLQNPRFFRLRNIDIKFLNFAA